MLIELNDLFAQSGLGFRVQLYCNSTFEMQIMQPVLKKLKFIADTNELFVRSVQMYQMFAQSNNTDTAVNVVKAVPSSPKTETFEGKAISRIPKWASAPTQNNHKIIRAYLQLQEEHGSVNRPDLERRCQQPERYPDVYVADFKGNFNSMKTDKANNHGKVFTDDGYHIGIWEAVAAVIEQYKPMFLA